MSEDEFPPTEYELEQTREAVRLSKSLHALLVTGNKDVATQACVLGSLVAHWLAGVKVVPTDRTATKKLRKMLLALHINDVRARLGTKVK